ncbi:MAG: biotin/lipoyl-containing protein [Desulfobacterales bacterium]
MIYSKTPRKIKVQFTPFRDGLQSAFGGKVRLEDYLPAMKTAAKDLEISHLEFGGGARYQAPFFYLNENPFKTMEAMRDTVGPETDLQILTRSISGVTLTTQSLEVLDMQARLMAKYGTTYDRNFDYMNDVENLKKTGRPIVKAGMHHQVCVAMMGLPFHDDRVHTPEFYADIAKQMIESDVRIDSICMKDASGTTDPKTCYETARLIRKIMPPEMELWLHTHDTASLAVSQYLAGIEGGADSIDLSVAPFASGTCQPDVRSVAHALKNTGYSLDIDVDKMHIIQEMLNDLLGNYEFNPVTTTADPRVVGFPMPGGAIGPNVHMMVRAGLMDRYSDVLAEFPVVVKAGGAWTSVTPGSQQYWVQAFNNVLYGRWEKIEAGYGRAVLGYYGKPPLDPDPQVVKKASEQLNLEPFKGDDPFAAVPDPIPEAKKALEENNLEQSEENIFLIVSSMLPGKKMALNEGLRLLTGKGKIDIPLKKKQDSKQKEGAQQPAGASEGRGRLAASLSGPVKTRCEVKEGGKTRTFEVTVEPISEKPGNQADAEAPPSQPAASGEEVPVYCSFSGSVDLVDITVSKGDSVKEGQTVAQVEAMKATHDIIAPVSGVVSAINARIGDEVNSSTPIITITTKG